MGKLIVIFDCMIFLQALISPKSIAFKLFERLQDGKFTLFISNEIFAEITNVLNRDYIRISNPQITDETVGNFLDGVLKKSDFYQKCAFAFRLSTRSER